MRKEKGQNSDTDDLYASIPASKAADVVLSGECSSFIRINDGKQRLQQIPVLHPSDTFVHFLPPDVFLVTGNEEQICSSFITLLCSTDQDALTLKDLRVPRFEMLRHLSLGARLGQ